MGKITEENRRSLASSDNYEDAVLSGMDIFKFREELSRLISLKEIPVQSIVDTTGLSKSYINKLRSFKEKELQPARPVILNIALALNASLDEVNNLLKSAHYQELYARNTEDSIIIWGLMHNRSGEQIRKKLSEMNVGQNILRQEQ